MNQALLCWRLPIFPGRRQPSIFGTSELNCRVRNGNGWTLTVINTNYVIGTDRILLCHKPVVKKKLRENLKMVTRGRVELPIQA